MKYTALLTVAVITFVLFPFKKPTGIYEKTGTETSIERITKPVEEPRAKDLPKGMTRVRSYPQRRSSWQDRSYQELRHASMVADQGMIYYPTVRDYHSLDRSK